jgi:type II secretory pathway component PulF
MPAFHYKAKDVRGGMHEGDLQGSERHDVIRSLREQGLLPLQVEEVGKSRVVPPREDTRSFSASFSRSPRIPLPSLLQFSTDLKDLLSAGMTLGEGVRILSRQKGQPLRQKILKDVHMDIVQGLNLSDALRKHPRSFPEFYISLIEAGEASGQIQDALATAVIHYERTIEAREQVKGALTYPLIVAGFGLLVVIFCLLFVIPQFSRIFTDMDRILPLPTRILLFLSQSLLTYGWVLLLAGAVGGLFLRRWAETPAGRMKWHRFKLRVPVLCHLIRSAAYANFARTLSHLMQNGVPVLRALDIVKKSANNAVIEKEIETLKHRVTDGSSLSKPLMESGIFPDVFTDMLSVGEEAGQVPRTLAQIARRYDMELNRNIKRITTLIEPLLMVTIAGIVGFVAISMLLPLFQLTQGLS